MGAVGKASEGAGVDGVDGDQAGAGAEGEGFDEGEEGFADGAVGVGFEVGGSEGRGGADVEADVGVGTAEAGEDGETAVGEGGKNVGMGEVVDAEHGDDDVGAEVEGPGGGRGVGQGASGLEEEGFAGDAEVSDGPAVGKEGLVAAGTRGEVGSEMCRKELERGGYKLGTGQDVHQGFLSYQ